VSAQVIAALRKRVVSLQLEAAVADARGFREAALIKYTLANELCAAADDAEGYEPGDGGQL
jgi:hypothetical protein